MRARGTCYVLFAFDVGFEADLRAAERLLIAPTQRRGLQHKLRSDSGALGAGAPLRFTRAVEPSAVGPHRTAASVELSLYDFGGLCVTFSMPIDGALADLVGTSIALWDNATLLAAARQAALEAITTLRGALLEPRLASVVEDYVIYEVQIEGGNSDALCNSHRQTLARVLRAEDRPLSDEEVENAMRGRIGYLPGQVVLVDWFAALLCGADMADERRVLELAHMELLELSFLESRVDASIQEAYGLLARSRRPTLAISPHNRELARIGRMQADSAMMHEGVDNAVKLLGDDYLARLYQIAAERFHVAGYDASLERKMRNLDSIYQRLADLAGRRRAELLEWIIIVLIALDIAIHLL